MSGAQFSIVAAGERRWRPPKVELRFDVTIRNEEPDACWAILPTRLPAGDGSGEPGSVRSISVYDLAGKGRVAAARFSGDPGFIALIVPGSSEIRLNRLPVAYWGEVPDEVELELATAEKLLADGRAAEELFGVDPLSDAGAEVDASPLADDAGVVHVSRPSDGRAFTVEWVGATAVRERVELASHRAIP